LGERACWSQYCTRNCFSCTSGIKRWFSKGEESILLELAAYHLIENTEPFHSLEEIASPLAQVNQLEIFGVF